VILLAHDIPMTSSFDDEFWSVAMNGRDEHLLLQDDSDDFDVTSCENIVRTITTLAPDPDLHPLVLRLCLNSKHGCLSDVSGDIWDASLLMAAFLYGTNEGQQLCYNACFGEAQVDGGGILELGSGLGLSGMAAAAAAAAAFHNTDVDNERISRVVLTDLDDSNILAQLNKNVESNLSEIFPSREIEASFERNRSCVFSFGRNRGRSSISMSVQSCNWSHVGKSRENADSQLSPKGTFNLIIGSALIYVPDHAVACAEAVSHYLCRGSCSSSQAIIIQLPDRAGFDIFLRRCHELDLLVSTRAITEEIMLSVERKIVSASDYRIYCITPRNN